MEKAQAAAWHTTGAQYMRVLCLGGEQRGQGDRGQRRGGGWRERCTKRRAHSKHSVCVHSLPREGAEGQKGEETNREGRKELGKKSVS